jgi:hypothetical protein
LHRFLLFGTGYRTIAGEAFGMNAASLINQTSSKTEYYTPPAIIEAARATMGGIDLDPASSEAANMTVRAKHYFTEKQDGLNRIWVAQTLWMNHPFSRTGNKLWINRLINHYRFRSLEQACCITFACTSEAWFAPLFAFPQCYLRPRTNYLLPNGEVLRGVTKGSVVTYLGPNKAAFAQNFAGLGAVMVPAASA